MTTNELITVKTRLNELETQAAIERRGIEEGIEAARTINANVRLTQAKLRGIDTGVGALRQQIREHEREEAVRVAVEAKAASEARALAEAAPPKLSE